MRVFAAVVPPEPIVEQLTEFLAPRASATDCRVRGRPSGWRWARPEQLHLTLAFVPDLDLGREEQMIEAGQDWAARQHPLELRLSGAGAFPNPVAAKVLWMGVAGPGSAHGGAAPDEKSDVPSRLADWAHGIRGVISHAGGRPEGRAFRPHLTVARNGSPGGQSAGRVLQSLDTYQSSPWYADTIVLMASTLGAGPGGTPRYDLRHEWRLGQGTGSTPTRLPGGTS